MPQIVYDRSIRYDTVREEMQVRDLWEQWNESDKRDAFFEVCFKGLIFVPMLKPHRIEVCPTGISGLQCVPERKTGDSLKHGAS